MAEMFIIGLCAILLVSYLFDITTKFTKIPSVIFLLAAGWLLQQINGMFNFPVPDFTVILPVLGTVGLILIVLEGSLELEMSHSAKGVIKKSMLVALVPVIVIAVGFAIFLYYEWQIPFKQGLINMIPFAIISSSIAIPSAINLISSKRQFITYESSLSDIFGVILFNFITLNDDIGASSVGHFVLEIFIILVITFVATLGLAFLLSKIKHPVKFIPIILSLVLIYAVTKVYHLPGLIFILLFGIFLGNLDELKNNKFIQKLKPDLLDKEVHKFKELTAEIAFLVRALFFLLFGYLIETAELLNTETIVWAIGICVGIFALRYISLTIFKINLKPILFIAPRGLITILLFLSIPDNQVTNLVNNSLVIQVIILSALVMMFGLMTNKPNGENT